ncbi:hypothetical protein HMPREF1246_0658 [Acidaminococcus sp. BV3L6]|nr:hypothetical protein HMPREF1246_0658 [Acidaminococcus sp. BV3L6]
MASLVRYKLFDLSLYSSHPFLYLVSFYQIMIIFSYQK